MSNNKYWQNFAELNDKEGVQKMQKDEFREELPFEDFDDKGILDVKTPRRDFLKYLGFSTAAASLAASCKVPVRHAIPYLNKPENVTPGVAKYYATTFVQDGEVVPLLAKVREGRPIKLEGNEISKLTLGGTSPRAQAAVLDLYDTHRLRFPARKGANNKFEEIPTFEQLDNLMSAAIASLGGAPIVLLTGTIASPTTKEVINQFLGRFPGSRHVQYDGVSYSGILQANEQSFGLRAVPFYQFDKAKVIVSLGADFLGTWLSPVQFARQYSMGRKLTEKNFEMSKHYQLESHLSMTGANADERFVHRPSEQGMVAMALLSALGGQAAAVNIADPKLRLGIQKIAADLQNNRGASLVVSGSNDPNVQTIVNAINSAIGAYGTTINWGAPVKTRQGIDTDMATLANAMNAGQIGGLFIYGANPVYDFFGADTFAAGMKKVKLTVSLNQTMDETTELCQFSVPSHHWLESWGDAEPVSGYICFIQPTIYPLFKTRPFETSLLKWSGSNTDYDTMFRQYWVGRLGGEQGFERALQEGVVDNGANISITTPFGTASTGLTSNTYNQGANTAIVDTTNRAIDNTRLTQTPDERTATGGIQLNGNRTGGGRVSGGAYNSGSLAGAVSALSAARRGGADEVVLYQNIAMATGKQSGNPWLLELPDPITRSCWGNFAMISIDKAKELGIDYTSTDYEYYPDKPVITLSANKKEVSLPALVIPGMQANTIAVSVGYGRHEALGRASKNVGQNVFGLARFNGSNIDYYNDVTVSGVSGSEKIAQVQIHNSYENRFEVVRETTMGTFRKYPNEIKNWRDELYKIYAPQTGDYRKEATLYGDHLQPGLKWGMSIDMNSCIGCGACVVACNAENNVPVVGRNEVLRYHDMHWLRIDRYFVSEENNPGNLKAVVFQPMLCQHCDNAPCENVCPVAATTHSSEGINQMIYNRCIGTRYCANNCPYKVRRFNWADYLGADSFADNQDMEGVGKLNEVVHVMNDDLTRMVLNPDVTTRSRGVMEKCTFCFQRIQAGKLKAKLENRPLLGDEVQTACADACPTSAIVFGNANDQTSEITQMRLNHTLRMYYVIEQIHTLPNISYLAKIRNTDEIVEKEHENVEHSFQSTDSDMPGVKPEEERH